MEEKETTIEENFEKLDDLLERMDSGDLSLEATFSLYEQGMSLLKDTSEKIDKVEKKVQVLQQDGSLSDFAGA